MARLEGLKRRILTPWILNGRPAWRAPYLVATGGLLGFGLGAAARAWMRLISTDPEFTWNGTAFIVIGFTLFGAGQGGVLAARVGHGGWRRVMVARVLGGLTIMPLFVAAGAIMAPTVVGAGLSTSRTDWRPLSRWVAAIVAAVLPTYVASTIISDFGYSPRTAAAMLGLVGIYAVVVIAAQATFAPQPDTVPLRRSTRRAIVAGATAVVALLLYMGGITT